TDNSRVLGQLPAIWLAAERSWIPPRAAIMPPPGAAQYSRTGAWNGSWLSWHATAWPSRVYTTVGSRPVPAQGAATPASGFASGRAAGGGYARGGMRDRVRGVPRAGRRACGRESQPASPLHAASDARRRRDDRPAGAARPAPRRAGLRAVPLVLGIRRRAIGA